MAEQVYVAIESGSCEIRGETAVVIKGQTLVPEGDPILKSCPHWFKPVEEGQGFGTSVVSFTATDDEIAEAETVAADHKAAVELADEHGLDIETVAGTGAGNVVTLADVQARLGVGEFAPPESEDDEDDDEPIIDATESAIELAKANDINLSTITGSGTEASPTRITKPDVEAAIAAKATS